MDPQTIQYSSQLKKIFIHGKNPQGGAIAFEFPTKGLSLSGFQGTNYVADGLWEVSAVSLLNLMKANGFNLLRLPLSLELILNSSLVAKSINYTVNPELLGKSPLQVLDFFVKEAGDRGILILLDIHCLA